jgi:hypothetical protein
MPKKKTTRRRSIGKGHMQKKKSIEYQLQRAEVIGYLKAKKRTSYDDISSHLKVDLDVIVNTCKEEARKGKIRFL